MMIFIKSLPFHNKTLSSIKTIALIISKDNNSKENSPTTKLHNLVGLGDIINFGQSTFV